VPAPALPELPAAVLRLPQRLIPISPEAKRTAASPARIDLPGGAPPTPAEPAERAAGPSRTLAGRPQHAAPEQSPARRPSRTWIRVTTAVAAAVVALVTASVLASTLRESGQPRDGALAPDSKAPASPAPSGNRALNAPASPGPTGTAALPTAGASRTANAGPGTRSNALPSIGETIDAISQIIDAGLVAREIRPDAAVDLRNLMQHLRDSVSRGAADLSAQVADLQSKVDARRREGAITGSSADQLDAELARLASY
jgi:hypothetical protein